MEASLVGDREAQIKTREDDLPEPSVPVADDNYLRYGWWETVDEDDSTKVSFRTFYGGQYGIQQQMTLATWKARRNMQVRQPVGTPRRLSTPTRPLTPFEHGEFTATARLTARFGGEDIAASKARPDRGRD